MSEISEKTKKWLFVHLQNARADLNEAHCGYEAESAMEKCAIFGEIVDGLDLWDDYREWFYNN